MLTPKGKAQRQPCWITFVQGRKCVHRGLSNAGILNVQNLALRDTQAKKESTFQDRVQGDAGSEKAHRVKGRLRRAGKEFDSITIWGQRAG